MNVHFSQQVAPVFQELLDQNSGLKLPAISVIGLGYVGMVSAACLSDLGHAVVGVDIDQSKIDALAAGLSPIVEPGLQEMLQSGVTAERITATDDMEAAILRTDVTFVSVNTPTLKDGGCNLKIIETVARKIGCALSKKSGFHVIVLRCSVPPGTTKNVFIPILERWSNKQNGKDFGVCFNPEFLRESTAIEDFRNPPKTVIGSDDIRASAILSEILAPVDGHPIVTKLDVAEMVKYTDNVWHAAKVCFGNEIGRLARSLKIDGHEVMDIFCQDTVLNISPNYLKPGFAYGGSCLPKEVRAMEHLASDCGVDLPMLKSLPGTNALQINSAVELIAKTSAKQVGLCGLAFKPNTDDLRESPVVSLAGKLLDLGYEVCVHDPAYVDRLQLLKQAEMLEAHYPEDAAVIKRLAGVVCFDVEELLERSDIVVTTQATKQWKAHLRGRVGGHHLVDVARLFKTAPRAMSYQGIGW